MSWGAAKSYAKEIITRTHSHDLQHRKNVNKQVIAPVFLIFKIFVAKFSGFGWWGSECHFRADTNKFLNWLTFGGDMVDLFATKHGWNNFQFAQNNQAR